MYPSQPSRQADSDWEYPSTTGYDRGQLQSALPKPPTYLPPPSPPSPPSQDLLGRVARPQRQWFRIPSEKPVLTIAILVVLVAIFLLTAIIGGSIDATENDLLLTRLGAKVNFLVVQGDWWRLITATFLHAGVLHIAANGFSLYMVGTNLELFFGRARFAAIYAISGLAGSVASFIFTPYTAVGVGASGAIFGLVGALAVYYGLNHSLFGKLGMAQFWIIIVVIILNLGLGVSGIFPIDNSAHVGGLIAGTAVGFVLCPRYKLADWMNPLVRPLVNTNKSGLSWLGAALIGACVVMLFFAILILYNQGYVLPSQLATGA